MPTAFKQFLTHTFFQWFTQSAFTTFGALLIYSLTGSLLGTLVYFVIHHLALVLIRSAGLTPLFRSINRFGFRSILIAGLFIRAGAFALFFIITPSTGYFYPLLFLISFVDALGITMYWTLSNSLLFSLIGQTGRPGHYTAYSSITRTIAGGLAAILGVVLNIQQYDFLTLFPLAAIFLILSVIPLWRMEMPHSIPVVSFRKALNRISPTAFIANVGGGDTLIQIALPLVILSTLSSFSRSVWVSASTALALILASYVAGTFKDRQSNKLTIIALSLIVVVWALYGVASTVSLFIILGFAYAVTSEVISTSRDARLSREVVNSVSPLEASAAIEFARAVGQIAMSLPLLLAYLLFHSVPQLIFLIGIPFIIPKGIYAMGKIATRAVTNPTLITKR